MIAMKDNQQLIVHDKIDYHHRFAFILFTFFILFFCIDNFFPFECVFVFNLVAISQYELDQRVMDVDNNRGRPYGPEYMYYGT